MWRVIFVGITAFLLTHVLGDAPHPLELAAYKAINYVTPVLANQKALLCSVFINVDNSSSVDILRDNMSVMKYYCDFAVISYKCSIGAHHRIEALAKTTGANLLIYRCVKPDETAKTHVSKPMLYDRLLPFLRFYERVWFLDEDLSLSQSFDAQAMLQTLDCAFWPRPPPLIAQPTTAESSQLYNFANWNTFAGTGVVAAFTDFIEIQMPIFNSTYLEWYIRYIVQPAQKLTREKKSQLLCGGFDSMFCRSAKSFAKKTSGHFNESTYVPCAIISAPNTAVQHINFKTIPKDQDDFYNNTSIQAHSLQSVFRSFMWWNFKKNDNGVFESPNWHEWEKVTALPESCPIRSYRISGFNTNALEQEESESELRQEALRKHRLRKRASGVGIPHDNREEKEHISVKIRRANRRKGRSEVGVLVDQLDKAFPATMTKVYALHFPQFHSDTLNNRIWGEQFSDWENLNSAPTENRLKNPLLFPTEMGYYDLLQTSVRKQQADLAKEYGVDGFIYHHYFFYEKGLGATLAAPLEALLVDNEPDLPFAFHWANQQWTATWQGKGLAEGELLQAQNYPNTSDPLLEEHYNFLKRFFHHKNYILVNGVPLFLVFQTFDLRCHPILDRLRELAMADGFPYPGIHIPQFRVNIEHAINKDVIPLKMRDTRKTMPGFASDAYYPSNHNFKGNMVPQFCRLGQRGNETRPVYLSTLTTFDNTPRRNFDTATVWDRRWSALGVVKSFERDLVETMMYDMCCQNLVAREQGGKFMMVNAWNEWAEGMVMEPNSLYGRKFLEAVQNAKRIIRRIKCSWPLYELYHSEIV